jgi:hypothetical protein
MVMIAGPMPDGPSGEEIHPTMQSKIRAWATKMGEIM